MKLILDTKKNLEYLDLNNFNSFNYTDFADPFDQDELIKHLISNDVFKSCLSTKESSQNKKNHSFPIGTIFTTLYNLSILNTHDLSKFLAKIKKLDIDKMNNFELLSSELLDFLGEDKIYSDLLFANCFNYCFGDAKKIRDDNFFEKMIPEHFLSFSDNDKLLLCKLSHPSFSIEANTRTSKSNPISTFFCIYSYFILSFCISYLHYSINIALRIVNKELPLSTFYDLFFNILKNDEKSFQADLSFILSNELELNTNERDSTLCQLLENGINSRINVFKWFLDLYNAAIHNLDFDYSIKSIELKHFPTNKIGDFLEDCYDSFNEIINIYNKYKVEVIDGNDTLPLIFSFKPQEETFDPLETLNSNNSSILEFQQYIYERTSENVNLALLDAILAEYDSKYHYRDHAYRYKNVFNTQPFSYKIKCSNDVTDSYNYLSSPYIDFFLLIFSEMFYQYKPTDNISLFVSCLYFDYFYYFSFLRSYEPTTKLFPNENLLSIQCNSLKDLLIASFYATTSFGLAPVIKCKYTDCHCVVLQEKGQKANCAFIDHKSKNGTEKNNRYSLKTRKYIHCTTLKQEYENYVRNIDISNKPQTIFKNIDEKLLDISTSVTPKKEEINNVIHVLNSILKDSYNILLKMEFSQTIIKNLDKMIFREYFTDLFDQFKELTKKKNGIAPLKIIRNNQQLYKTVKYCSTILPTSDRYSYAEQRANQMGLKSLYKLKIDKDDFSIDYVKYNFTDYLSLVDTAEKIFINLLIKYYRTYTENPNLDSSKIQDRFNIKDEIELTQEYDPIDFENCIKWCKDYKYYNGVTIILDTFKDLRNIINSVSQIYSNN